MKSWLPALAALAAAIVLATLAGAVLSGLVTGPGTSQPVALKTVTPGALDRMGIRLTRAALPPECTPAAWLHFSLPGRCPITQAQAQTAATASVPRFLRVPMAVDAAVSSGQIQVREAVLAWADVPAGSAANAQAIHGLVWSVAVDEPNVGNAMCPPPVMKSRMATVQLRACFTSPRYLVFIDAMTAKPRLLMARP